MSAIYSAYQTVSSTVARMIPRRLFSISPDEVDPISQISQRELNRFLGIQEKPRVLLGCRFSDPILKKTPTIMNEIDMAQLVKDERVLFPNGWPAPVFEDEQYHIDFTECSDKSEAGVVSYIKSVEGYQNVVSLQFHPEIAITPSLTSELCRLCPNVEQLLFTQSQFIDPIGLGVLQPLKNLKYLDVSSSCRINDACMANIAILTQLRGLNVSGCLSITNEGFAYIRDLKQLRQLQASWCLGLSDLGMTSLMRFKDLEHLELQGNRIHDMSCVMIHFLTHLKYLDLGFIKQIDYKGIDVIMSGCSQLRFLSMRGAYFGPADCLESLSRFKKIEKIDLGMVMSVNNAVLSRLSKIETVTDVNLDGCHGFDHIGISSLKGMKISKLSLANTGEHLSSAEEIFFPETLEHLDLEGFEVADQEDFLKTLGLLTHLKSLRLSGLKSLTPSVIASWGDLANLEILRIRGCHVDEAVVEEIEKSLSHLKTLEITPAF